MTDASNDPSLPASQPSRQPPSDHPEKPLVPSTPGAPLRRSWLPLVLITAIIAGGLGVLATFLVMRSGTGQEDVTIACDTVERIGFPLDEDEFRMDMPLVQQLLGLSGFTSAAVIGDDANAELREPGQQLRSALQQADVEKINEALESMSTACGNIEY